MTAYGKNNLYNKYVRENASDAFELGLIPASTLDAIMEAHPVKLYTPNIFIRIGLGLLSAIAIIFFGVLVGLITGISEENSFVALCIILAISCYGLLELFVSSNKYFNAGIDNVLMIVTVIFVIAAFNINSYKGQYELTSAFTALLCCWLSIRFNDSLMAAFSFAAVIACCFFLCTNSGDTGKIIVPFAVMFLSAFFFFISIKLHSLSSLVLYKKCLDIVKLLALVCFYLSVNYYVVRELGNLMFETPLEPGEAIPFGWFFWLCTVVIPPAYFVYGIAKKDGMFVRLGFILAITSVLTFRYYHAVLPVSAALIFFGVVFICGAWWLIRDLRISRRGFTSLNIYKAAKDISDAEALIIAQAFGHHEAPPQPGVQFGGGSSGGAGATGNY